MEISNAVQIDTEQPDEMTLKSLIFDQLKLHKRLCPCQLSAKLDIPVNRIQEIVELMERNGVLVEAKSNLEDVLKAEGLDVSNIQEFDKVKKQYRIA